jgi:hypothetical protein
MKPTTEINPIINGVQYSPIKEHLRVEIPGGFTIGDTTYQTLKFAGGVLVGLK